jgi:signal transduction histidine kinase
MNEELRELQARHDRLLLLHQAANVLHSTLEPQPALQLILKEAVRLMNASSGSLVLVNPTTNLLEIHASCGLPPEAARLKLRVGEGITGWVARTGKPARVGNVAEDRRYVLVRADVRSELAVPLEVNGEVRGVLNVDSDRADAFTREDQELLESLAAQAAIAIHHTWLYEQLRLKARLFESLISVSQIINSTLSLDDVLSAITREGCQLMQAKVCSLMLLDPSRQWLDLRASFGASEAYVHKPRLSMDESLLGVVVRRKKPLQVENVQTSSRYQNVEVARQEGLISLLSVPLLFRGDAIGTLSVYTGRPYSFSNEEIRILSALAELSATAIEKARLYERVVDAEELLRENEKLAALGLLSAEVAHEIRNPLTVMKMLYHSLDLKFPTGDPKAQDARIIAEKIDHLNRFVEQILALSRDTEPRLEAVNVNALLEELNLLVRHKLKNQQVEWVREFEPNLRPVLGDPGQLEQAFLNLILNAVEAMPQGGNLTIRSYSLPGDPAGTPKGRGSQDSAIRAKRASARVVLEFQDTGQGMNAKQRRQAFTSVLNSTKPKGTGLGLAIVARIIETHHGRIKILSGAKKGTTVRVMLPVAS